MLCPVHMRVRKGWANTSEQRSWGGTHFTRSVCWNSSSENWFSLWIIQPTDNKKNPAIWKYGFCIKHQKSNNRTNSSDFIRKKEGRCNQHIKRILLDSSYYKLKCCDFFFFNHSLLVFWFRKQEEGMETSDLTL